MRAFARLTSLEFAGLLNQNRSLNQNRMTGGFLGQVQRGRARVVRGGRCGRAGAAVWVGLVMVTGVARAQQVPVAPPGSTPPPARTAPVVARAAVRRGAYV